MSHVRMCDKCQLVFSEAELGWQTYSATTVNEDDFGHSTNRTLQMDACHACAFTPLSRRERRIAQLEREVGMEPDPT